MTQKLSRRTFLKRVGLAGAGLALISCTAPPSQQAASSEEADSPAKYTIAEIVAPS
ncbi:twin-arginine translocation signal domain-containing protein [Chloroflexi bacterium TSY]|nr:twin-arginine translocation signal domain-containing protein [Chloroflexi bacterium TSY]